MRRVALACRWIDGVTGTTTGILERTRRFSRQGWEVHLFGERLDKDRILAAGGVPHGIFKMPFFGDWRRRRFAGLFDARRGREGYDLLEGHGDTLDQDVLMLHNCVHAAHEAIHGAPMNEALSLGILHARILKERRFRLLIANSELMKNDVVRRFSVPPENVAVVHPGYDPARFRAEDRLELGAPMRRELGVEGHEVLVGLVTSGDFRKRGVALFLRALARVRGEGAARMRAVVIGKERRMDSFRNLARELGLSSRIRFLPPTPQVQRFYHALDVFAYPALFEEFGQSVQEAMACGVPVLTSARVGATELLDREGRGMLLEAPDADAMARRLEELIARPHLRRRWGEAAAAAAAPNTWDRNFKRTSELYEALLSPSGVANRIR
jgi:UDP-glucose:(heptosyl)LPS alpha-1,3-glucosyltransferase